MLPQGLQLASPDAYIYEVNIGLGRQEYKGAYLIYLIYLINTGIISCTGFKEISLPTCSWGFSGQIC